MLKGQTQKKTRTLLFPDQWYVCKDFETRCAEIFDDLIALQTLKRSIGNNLDFFCGGLAGT